MAGANVPIKASVSTTPLTASELNVRSSTPDSGPLLGDCTPELPLADRPPKTHEQNRVREHAQEIAERDAIGGQHRREDVLELGEERQRGSERQPAVEILAAPPETEAEADNRQETEQRLQPEGDGQQLRMAALGQLREMGAERAAAEPDRE